MPDITGLHHIAFTVRDLDRSAAWYSELFGFAKIGEVPDDGVSGAKAVLYGAHRTFHLLLIGQVRDKCKYAAACFIQFFGTKINALTRGRDSYGRTKLKECSCDGEPDALGAAGACDDGHLVFKRGIHAVNPLREA